ncbi:MAG: hypothetical protein ACETWK_06185 [Candidatus Aminicenantaceae bacterium]
MKKVYSFLWLVGIFVTSAGGIAAFIVLFVLDFNIYWLILSPIIFALYQAPAVLLFWLWKKRRFEK